MKAVQLSTFGAPSEVLGVVDVPDPRPGPGQVLVALEAAPINPSDFMLVEGHYPARPELPATGGAEGVGRISATGAGVDPARVGQRVLLVPTLEQATWQELTVIDQDDVVPVPEGADALQLAMVGINPMTAQVLLGYADLQPGDWVAQTAANSAVGRYLIALAKRAGLRTLNVVRRAEVAQELLDAGADVVLVSGEDLGEQAARALGDDRITLLVSSLGGQVIGQLAPLLAHGGVIVTYAALNGEPAVVSPVHLNFNDLTVRGFWLNNWLTSQPKEVVAREYARVIDLTADGTLSAPVAATYDITDAEAAVQDALRTGHDGREGKVLLTFGGRS